MFEDRTIVCAQCGMEFVFASAEQEFYQQKGLTHAPKRCRGCRSLAKKDQAGHPPVRAPAAGSHVEYIGSTAEPRHDRRRPRSSSERFEAACSVCGAMAQLPFRPDGVRPIYCRTCYQGRRRSGPTRP